MVQAVMARPAPSSRAIVSVSSSSFAAPSSSSSCSTVLAPTTGMTEGRLAMTVVTLHPDARFSGDRIPTREELGRMHLQAHEACFIANSVRTEVRCEPKLSE